MLSSPAPTAVGIGAPLLVAFNDPTATAGTTFTANSTNADLTATVLKTPEMLKMKVHTVNADGSTGTSGEMDFLLLEQYAPNNIAHIVSLVRQRLLQRFDVPPHPFGLHASGRRSDRATAPAAATRYLKVDDEFSADLRFDSTGLLALANSGPDTNDCQFFIMNAAYPSLDFGYTIIGDLVAGDSLRQAIANVPVRTTAAARTASR